ncbi:MAG: hypothetical protein WC438_04450 [Candidatus Pacearchaeota archaeon]
MVIKLITRTEDITADNFRTYQTIAIAPANPQIIQRTENVLTSLETLENIKYNMKGIGEEKRYIECRRAG